MRRADERKRLVVQVDPDLSDLIPGFLANKRKDTAAILSAIAADPVDFEALSRLGHKLKGEGGSYGLEPISSYGAEIEQAAKNQEVELLRRYAREISTYLDSVEIVYE
jgi:HPt (histidine-containing phosphotransfer) domain-containing protein